MELFKQILISESEKSAGKEVSHVISVINKAYNEWKKIKRRINAVDIVSTSVNKIAAINPATVDHIHAAAKAKLCIIIMRCLDIPVWKGVESKMKYYKKLYPLLSKLQNEPVSAGTGGNLRDIIMTRLSAAISYAMTQCEVFVSYEPSIPTSYIRYLFGSTPPKKTYRMQSLPLPEDYESLLETLKINQQKAMAKYQAGQS